MDKLAFSACLLGCALAWGDTSAPGEAKKIYVLATLERTACFGSCPSYSVTILSDGRVEWNGRQFVKLEGKAQGTLTSAELTALKAAFADIKYLELGEGFDCREWTDNPSAITSFSDGTRKKSIAHYYGCRSKAGVKELTELENKIDRIVKTDRWIGTEKERHLR